MLVRHWISLIGGLAMFGASACGLFGEDKLTDGDVCSTGDDCETGVCTSASLCSHSRCECPSGYCPDMGGEESPDCRDGWVCVQYDSIFDPLKEFFGGMPNPSDGYCQPSCAAGCPEHYICDGELCSADLEWATPEPTIVWSGAVEGELTGRDQMTTVVVEEGSTIAVSGSAESAVGAPIVTLAWTTVSSAGDFMYFDGASIETMIPMGAGDYRRVEFDATDEQGRTGHISVIFEACTGAGGVCGWEGSGCCDGCETASNTCM